MQFSAHGRAWFTTHTNGSEWLQLVVYTSQFVNIVSDVRPTKKVSVAYDRFWVLNFVRILLEIGTRYNVECFDSGPLIQQQVCHLNKKFQPMTRGRQRKRTPVKGFPLVILVAEWFTVKLGALQFTDVRRVHRTILQTNTLKKTPSFVDSGFIGCSIIGGK